MVLIMSKQISLKLLTGYFDGLHWATLDVTSTVHYRLVTYKKKTQSVINRVNCHVTGILLQTDL